MLQKSETPPRDSLSDILHRITNDMDFDLAITLAGVINLYINAISRHAHRSIITPTDAVNILRILTVLQEAFAQEHEPELIPGAPTRRTETKP